MFNWNDLKFFLAVARHGSTIAAGKALRISQSTVQRRLVELEKKIKRKLVSRTAAGYRLTEFGQELLPYAERIEAMVGDFERHISDMGRDRGGVIRVTCPEPIVQRMTPLIERFHARHPNLRVEFVMSDRYLDLSKGDADVAFRSGDTDDELIGRKIADSIWAVYASEGYIAQHGRPMRVEDLSLHPLVCLDESMSGHRVAKWLKEVVPDARVKARNNSVLGMMYAVKSGVGIGPRLCQNGSVLVPRAERRRHSHAERKCSRNPFSERPEAPWGVCWRRFGCASPWLRPPRPPAARPRR